MILNDFGDLIKCDVCGTELLYDDSGNLKIRKFWKDVIFHGRVKPDELWMDYCIPCAKKVTPLVYRLLDIFDLKTHANKLERNIRDVKRNKNNRPIESDACKCCKSCISRRNGNTESGSDTQAGEEHY